MKKEKEEVKVEETKSCVEEQDFEQSEESEQSIKEQLDKLTADFESQKDLLLRTAAEFDNYKKRTQREMERIGADTRADILKKLLPSLDNFLRVGDADSSSDEYKKGVEMSIKTLVDLLTNLGLEEINCENAEFDPNIHYAVAQVEDENLGENIVSQVMQKGYKVGDTVIRPAMVSVANCK